MLFVAVAAAMTTLCKYLFTPDVYLFLQSFFPNSCSNNIDYYLLTRFVSSCVLNLVPILSFLTPAAGTLVVF